MKIDKALIESYEFEDYEKAKKIIEEKYEILSSFCEQLTKINSILDKFIDKKVENKILKKTLSTTDENDNFYTLFSFIQKYFERTFKESNKMIKKMVDLLINLKEEIKENLKKYDEFLIYQNEFMNKLNELEDFKKTYLDSVKNAELVTYNFLKKKLNNEKVESNEFFDKEKTKKLIKEEMGKYKAKIEELNKELKLYNEKQKEMYKIDKDLEIKYENGYSNCLLSYYEHQLIIADLGEKYKSDILSIDIDKNNEKLNTYLNNLKQKEQIDFVKYETQLDFDNCDGEMDFNACFMTYQEIRTIIGEYKDINYEVETKKFALSKEIDGILRLDDKIINSKERLFEIIENDLGQQLFINVLSTLRASGSYEKSENFVKTIEKAFNFILEEAEKNNDYDKAKNCIILSQTYYYILNKEKIYIFQLISNNKWLKSPSFWRAFTDFMIKQELDRTASYKTQKLNDILLTQLLPYVNNMIGFNMDKRIIIKIIDEISEKYKYLNEESLNTIFTLLGCNNEQVEMYRKEIKENKDLENELYNNETSKGDNNKTPKDNNNETPKNGNNKVLNGDNNVKKNENKNKISISDKNGGK